MPAIEKTVRAQVVGGAVEAVTGVQLMQGVGVAPAKGFWADAWAQVMRQPRVVAALCWLSLVAFFAVFAPFLANGHPLVLREPMPGGKVITTYPLLEYLKASDLILAIGAPVGLAWIFLSGRQGRTARFGAALIGALQIVAIMVIVNMVQGAISRPLSSISDWASCLKGVPYVRSWLPGLVGVVVCAVGVFVPAIERRRKRFAVGLVACTLAAAACAFTWTRPLPNFNYTDREQRGQVAATYVPIPWSPGQRLSALDRLPPGTALGDALKLEPDAPTYRRRFFLGTDAFGSDVLSQLMHACRLSISIGLVSTGVAVLIGVTIGSLMGYFGGWVDMLLFRVVEVFMAVPLLFLLIIAAAVLPEELRSTYTMMLIIGCFTWTGAARFTRAEFLKLRSQDFVQSAKAVGLPLRSILFKHMLPNGVTPVLVDASFTIAAAITIEATLSFLGLGPIDQASWGKLLSSATNAEGQFKWWLAVFPGAAIFLTVLSYNLIGEALRDAIDPKLKKARV